MNEVSSMLVSRIRGELEDLDRAARRAGAAWQAGLTAGNRQDFYLDSVALNLHGFYSGAERLFELIVRHLDGALPSGANWHRDLLLQVAVEVPGVRPAVISAPVAAQLDEYRRFRHLVRNVYTSNLAPDRIAPLVAAMPKLWRQLSAELSAFADFLEQAAS